jgi:DNA (cytosine-5)-methyltransferase 1
VNFLSLFAGIGGFDLAAYNAGLRFDKHFFSEVDDYAVKVFQKRFPDAIALGDVRNIRGTQLPNGEWIITGGFPCQDLSCAGRGGWIRWRKKWFIQGIHQNYWRVTTDLHYHGKRFRDI